MKYRLKYIDNIRLLMIFFVVLMHIAVTYSGFGDWCYKESGEIGVVQTVFFGFFQAFTQGYAMGILFLIAGYFIPESYDTKGFSRFIKDRAVRLGVPTLLYMLIVNPFIMLCLLNHRLGDSGLFASYVEYLTGLHFIGSSGPLWFALALLIFTIIYALIRRIFAIKASAGDKDIPAFSRIVLLILLIGLCAFIIRIFAPVGTSVLNMQLCYFSSYVFLFVVGLKCRRNNWLEKLDYATGKPWLLSGILLGFVLFVVILVSGGGLDGDLSPFEGGATWQSAAYALWEAFVAVSMSIGLIALYKEKYNRQSRIIEKMSANAFAVYAFHAPIVVVISLLFAPVSLIPIVKFAVVGLVGVPVCFLLTNFTIRQVPVLRRLYV